MIFKTAIAIAALSGATALIPSSALAGGVSIGIGIPSAYGPGYSPYEGEYYYDPIYIGGGWYHGPYRWRMERGERVFFVNGGWHRNEWRGGAMPNTIMFRNGGSFRGGRNEGFGDATRINARFRSGNGIRDDRRDLKGDRREMRDDRKDVRQDRREIRDERHDGNRPHN
jgi:hypothetical protein